MRHFAGIAMGLAILTAPTSSAYAMERVSVAETVVSTETASHDASNGFSEVLVFGAWASSALVGTMGIVFLPGAVKRDGSRRKVKREVNSQAQKIEETFGWSNNDLNKSLIKLKARLAEILRVYGPVATVAAASRYEETVRAIETVGNLQATLPAARRSLADCKNRLNAVLAVQDAVLYARSLIAETHSHLGYIVNCEKGFVEKSEKIEGLLTDADGLRTQAGKLYDEFAAKFDADYIDGMQEELDILNKSFQGAKDSLKFLRGWLDNHNLEMARVAFKRVEKEYSNTIAAYRAFRSRAMTISSFDLTRDEIIGGVTNELDANIPENRAEGMARIIGDARVAVKDARKIDTTSGNPEVALETAMAPIRAYRQTVAELRGKRESTDAMKKTVFSAMDEATTKHYVLLNDLSLYHITPDPEERASLERIDAVLLHNFAKIRFDAASLPLFDVEKTAVWSGNALQTILQAQTHGASLKARLEDARAAEQEARQKVKVLAQQKSVQRKAEVRAQEVMVAKEQDAQAQAESTQRLEDEEKRRAARRAAARSGSIYSKPSLGGSIFGD